MFQNTASSLRVAGSVSFAVLILLVVGSPAHAVDWSESPDAGDLPGTAQVTTGPAGEPLNSIFGTIASTSDIDLYKIRITEPSNFSAFTVGGDSEPFDSMLALFDEQGFGVYQNDDRVFDDGNSELPAFHPLGPSTPGIYYLAIFSDDSAPFSGAGTSFDDAIFDIPDCPPCTEVTGPSSTGGVLPLNGWLTFEFYGLNAGYQLILTGAEPAETDATDLVELNGTVQDTGGTPLCAMVLASGQFMFSCNPNGPFSLTDLPREANDTVKRQVYVDGFFPEIDVLTGSANETVVMTRSGTCPEYNTPYDPGDFPGSAGNRIDISGSILLQNSQTPVCAMVLANGQFMFSCDGSGQYNLNIPLDNSGQFKLQVYADGFAPKTQRFDEFSPNNDVRMARAAECQ